MRKIISTVLILCIVMGISIGCQSGEINNVEANANEPNVYENPFDQSGENDEYIFVLGLQNIEYFNAHKYMWEKIGEDFGVKTSVVGPSEMDVNATASAIEQAIAKKPKGIIIWGFDSGLDSAVNNAIAAGIPVVPIIGDLPTSDRTTYVGSNQKELGYLGGKALGEELGGKGKVAILTLPGVRQFDLREEGFREALAELYPEIEIVSVGDTKADLAIALQAAKDIINANPDLNGFFGTDSTAAFGAVNGVNESNKTGDIKVVGMDRNSDILQEIKNGNIAGTIAQNDVGAVYWAFLTCFTENYYEPPITINNEEANVVSAPSVIYVTPNYVNTDSVDFYLDANEMYAK